MEAAQAVREWLGRSGVADEVRDYAADTASGLLEDMSVSFLMHMCTDIYIYIYIYVFIYTQRGMPNTLGGMPTSAPCFLCRSHTAHTHT